MGAFESSDAYDYAPPPPPRSTLFVVRNGRYEPQNLMPVLPRSDILDFDGFVVRRGVGAGCMNARPPEMRQASLIKSPVSIRRDSARILGPNQTNPNSTARKNATSMFMSSGTSNANSTQDGDILTFIFDAQRGGQLSVHLLVREAEQPLVSKPLGESDLHDVDETSEEAQSAKKGRESVPRTIELLPQERPEYATQMAPVALELEARAFGPGLGQCYESPTVDLSRWPAERLAFDTKRPRDIPIAVRMEADPLEGEPQSIHYTYISLQGRSSAPESCGQENLSGDNKEAEDVPQQEQNGNSRGIAQIFAQKLQYGGECFVLHEVFGVSSKATDADAEGGNSDCVICLSEPRDTAVLPCRHMCFCSYCAGIVRLQCDRCPVCRQKVASLLQFKRSQDNTLEVLRGDSGKTNGPTETKASLPMTSTPAAIGSACAASAAAAMSRRPSTHSNVGTEPSSSSAPWTPARAAT